MSIRKITEEHVTFVDKLSVVAPSSKVIAYWAAGWPSWVSSWLPPINN